MDVETRPIISGDFSQQPALKKYNIKKQKLYKMLTIFINLVFTLVYIRKKYQIKI